MYAPTNLWIPSQYCAALVLLCVTICSLFGNVVSPTPLPALQKTCSHVYVDIFGHIIAVCLQ